MSMRGLYLLVYLGFDAFGVRYRACGWKERDLLGAVPVDLMRYGLIEVRA